MAKKSDPITQEHKGWINATVAHCTLSCEIRKLANKDPDLQYAALSTIVSSFTGIHPRVFESLDQYNQLPYLKRTIAAMDPRNQFQPSEGDHDEILLDNESMKILYALSDSADGALSQVDLVSKTILSEPTIRERLKRLAELQYVAHPPKKKRGWGITQKGRDAIRQASGLA